MTAVNPGGWGFLTAWPCTNPAEGRPNTSMSNYDGAWGATANQGLVELGATGGVCVYSFNSADLIVDVSGYVAR